MAGYRTICDDGALRISVAGDPPQLAMAGEIDESTYPALVSSLEAAAAGQHEIHIQLRDVAYCDLAGLRAIVRLARPGPAGGVTGRHVVLHGLSAHLRAILRILGWDVVAGLTIAPVGAEHAAGVPADQATERLGRLPVALRRRGTGRLPQLADLAKPS